MNVSEFWSPERVALLEQRWKEGATCPAIADEIGCSKNAVIGKARRIDLPMRLPGAPPKPKSHDPFENLGPRDCRWPIGHPRDPGFHFCRDRVLPEKPYCEQHAAKAYVTPPKAKQSSDGWTGWTEEKRAVGRKRLNARDRPLEAAD